MLAIVAAGALRQFYHGEEMSFLNESPLSDYASQLSDLARAIRDHADQPVMALPGRWADLSAEAKADMLLRQRQARKGFLPPSLFHEPAWELLLSLFIAHRRGIALNVKHLVSLVDSPVTTSQRWIDQLVYMKLVLRVVDPTDRRRLELSLSDSAAESLQRYLDSI